MSTPITDRAAIVLQQIDAALALAEKATPGPWTAQPADSPQIMSPKNEHCVSTTYGCYATKEDKANNATFIAASRTLLPASLRCLKTAIEGLIEADEWIAAAQDDALSAEAYGRAERYREASEDCAARLKSILDTWRAAQ